MLEQMKANVEMVVFSIILFNIVMTIIHGLLGLVKNYTVSKVDNKIWKFIGKLMGVGQKAIDYSVANKAH